MMHARATAGGCIRRRFRGEHRNYAATIPMLPGSRSRCQRHAKSSQSSSPRSPWRSCSRPSASAKRDVPKRFFGVVWDGDITNAIVGAQEQQWDRMLANGVESTRVAFHWSAAQPTKGVAPSFARTDGFVRLAASRGIDILPQVLSAPDWARINPSKGGSPPRDPADYTAYLKALVGRYGPNGTFWTENPTIPKRPIREWVIWNEPHFIEYWTAPNWEKGYGKLLRAAYKAIHSADKGARVGVAGLTGASWDFLERLYKKGSLKGNYDFVTIHPYTHDPSGLPKIVRRVRESMSAHGEGGKRLYITEFGWSASKGSPRCRSRSPGSR